MVLIAVLAVLCIFALAGMRKGVIRKRVNVPRGKFEKGYMERKKGNVPSEVFEKRVYGKEKSECTQRGV